MKKTAIFFIKKLTKSFVLVRFQIWNENNHMWNVTCLKINGFLVLKKD